MHYDKLYQVGIWANSSENETVRLFENGGEKRVR